MNDPYLFFLNAEKEKWILARNKTSTLRISPGLTNGTYAVGVVHGSPDYFTQKITQLQHKNPKGMAWLCMDLCSISGSYLLTYKTRSSEGSTNHMLITKMTLFAFMNSYTFAFITDEPSKIMNVQIHKFNFLH